MSTSRTVWVLSGLSGAGRTTALLALEAAGAECIDNLPAQLLGALVSGAGRTGAGAGPVVAAVDARQGSLDDWGAIVRDLPVKVLFLDARDEVLVRRLADSVRPHPCAAAGRGLGAVRAERALLEPLRAGAEAVLDSSELDAAELGRRVVEVVDPGGVVTDAGFVCTVSSFGFKYGAQTEADWVVDVRFLRNPFWDQELRPLTGLDEAVHRYIWEQPEAPELVDRLAGLVSWVIGRSTAHGRNRLHVALGCTGGRHRSVAVAEALAGRLAAEGTTVLVRHRDVDRPEPR